MHEMITSIFRCDQLSKQMKKHHGVDIFQGSKETTSSTTKHVSKKKWRWITKEKMKKTKKETKKDVIEIDESKEEEKNGKNKVKRLWGASPHYYSRWNKWGVC